MKQVPQPSHPTMPERHNTLLSQSELNGFIQELAVAYEETRNEKVLKVLNRLRSIKAASAKEFWRMEEIYHQEDLKELLENPGKFPFSVVTWAMYYRDQELS